MELGEAFVAEATESIVTMLAKVTGSDLLA